MGLRSEVPGLGSEVNVSIVTSQFITLVTEPHDPF